MMLNISNSRRTDFGVSFSNMAMEVSNYTSGSYIINDFLRGTKEFTLIDSFESYKALCIEDKIDSELKSMIPDEKYDGLSYEECVKLITDEVNSQVTIKEFYTENLIRAYRYLNNLKDILVLDSIANNKLESQTTVYRGAPSSWIESADSSIISDPSFCSTSTSKEAVEEVFAKQDGNRLYTIILPKDTKCIDLSKISHENEIILPRNSKFKVIDAEKGILELVLEV